MPKAILVAMEPREPKVCVPLTTGAWGQRTTCQDLRSRGWWVRRSKVNRRWLLVLILVVACGRVETPRFEIVGLALSGPSCPVETDPPDPTCAPQPVVGATIEALDEAGDLIASADTAADGHFALSLPPGDYTLVPQPVEGLLGLPSPIAVSVVDEPVDLGVIEYDTGIR